MTVASHALRPRVALVAGGADGAGAATVRRLALAGMHVVVADVQDDRGESLASQVGPQCSYLHASASSESDMRRAIAATLRRFGRIDCMVVDAGVPGPPLGITATTPETWDAMLAVVLRSAYLGMHLAAQAMRAQPGGSIICTAAISGLRAGAGSPVASAANAAVMQLTRSVALELGSAGVRVNCVCRERPDQGAEEAAAAIAWLASDAGADVNGCVMVVGGAGPPLLGRI